MQIKKSSLFTSTGWWRQFNGFYFTLSAISSHSWPSVTRGWKWHLVRDQNNLVFFTPVTVNKYSWFYGRIFSHDKPAKFKLWLLLYSCYTVIIWVIPVSKELRTALRHVWRAASVAVPATNSSDSDIFQKPYNRSQKSRALCKTEKRGHEIKYMNLLKHSSQFKKKS